MNLLEVATLYLIAGAISAVVLGRHRRETGRRQLLYLVLALLLWPLWLPVILAQPKPEASGTTTGISASEQTLWQGYEAVKGTPLEKLLPRESVERIAAELRRVGQRDRELTQILLQPSFSLDGARARVAALEQQNTSPRALALALRHRENIERLVTLQARDRQVLGELGDWLSILRTQLVLARYSGSSVEGIGDIFAEVCARVEVLGSTLDEPDLLQPLVPELAWPSISS
jgi:hypothetical protein